jgi:hypothetical protein
MNSEIRKKMIRTGSLFMVFCFSLSVIFGVLVQATTPSTQTVLIRSNPHPNNIDTGTFSIGFGDERAEKSIIPDSQSNTVDVSARVYVKHYHRRDGTPVRSHYRRDPR